MVEQVERGADELRVSFASDINPLLAEAFLEEAPVHAGRFSEIMGRLTGNDASLADVVQAQRVVHSLKGSASITGVLAIVSVTHQAEDILDWLADSGELPSPELRETLVDTADCVAAMVDTLRTQGPVPKSTARVLARLRQWRERQTAARAPATDREDVAPAVAPLPDAGQSSAADPSLPEQMPSTAVDMPPAGDKSSGDMATPATLRVSVSLVDRLLRLAGELAVTNVQAQGAQQRMALRAYDLREQYHLLQQRLADLQDVVEIRGVPSRMRQRSGVAMHAASVVDEFDPLELDEFNELHSKNTALAEAVADFCELALGMRPELARMDDTIADQQRIGKQFSDSVLSARMVPVGSVEQSLQRAVRETCRETGKLAILDISGGDIPVDGDVLNALVDPLLHLLRNAVDHGIEIRAQREAAGKSLTGSVQVRFARDGENLLVQVRDDGAGFDIDGIREVAQRRGMMSGEDVRADRELLQMTVSAGFSTRREVTQISGRGIGMDVVQRAALDLKGSLDIASTPGAGATVSLRVPLTLISMHVLLVRAGSQVFGVPSASLHQILVADASALQREGDAVIVTLEDQEYDVRRLEQLLGRPADPAQGRKQLSLLLIDADHGPTAIVVDKALDGRYLVVNSLGPQVPRPPGVIGACILGDGDVAPVLDLRELLRRRPVAVAGAMDAGTQADIEPQIVAPEVLVVDDSLTARRMLSIAIGDAGYRVRTAIDGLDAVEAIEDAVPDLLVTDLEMPRMNGLELAGHLRGDDATAGLPIVMVTSRSTDKHRGQAQTAGINDFITKPYSNQDLLDIVARLLARTLHETGAA